MIDTCGAWQSRYTAFYYNAPNDEHVPGTRIASSDAMARANEDDLHVGKCVCETGRKRVSRKR